MKARLLVLSLLLAACIASPKPAQESDSSVNDDAAIVDASAFDGQPPDAEADADFSCQPACSDGDFCNGEETCVGGSCEPGDEPCPVTACFDRSCLEATDECTPLEAIIHQLDWSKAIGGSGTTNVGCNQESVASTGTSPGGCSSVLQFVCKMNATGELTALTRYEPFDFANCGLGAGGQAVTTGCSDAPSAPPIPAFSCCFQ